MSGQVLTVFFLPMGATLIQGVCKAGFVRCTSLDAGRVERAPNESYVNNYWHTSCIARLFVTL